MEAYKNMLTQGALKHIIDGIDVEKPILQILNYKDATCMDGTLGVTIQRFRCLMNDGQFSNQNCLLLGKPARFELLEKYSLIRLDQYNFYKYQGKNVIVITNAEMIAAGKDVVRKIGNPSHYDLESSFSDEASGSNTNRNQSPISTPTKRLLESIGSCSPKKPRFLSDPALCVPIMQLVPSPSSQSTVIKGRVILKSDIREYKTSRSEGKLFSFALKDLSGEIKCTAFKTNVDRFFDLIQLDKVIILSRVTIKKADLNYSWTSLELILLSDSVVQIEENNTDCPRMSYDFCPISRIEFKDVGTYVDVIGICYAASGVQTVTARNGGRDLKKQQLDLLDHSDAMIKLTIWGSQAENFTFEIGKVVVVPRAKISSFNGRSLSVGAFQMLEDPQLDFVISLKRWFHSLPADFSPPRNLSTSASTSLTNLTLIKDLISESSIVEGKFFTINGEVCQIGKPTIYPSCPGPNCKKKVTKIGSNLYHCDKCNSNKINALLHVTLKVCIVDYTGECWATIFNDTLQELLGVVFADILREVDEESADFQNMIDSLEYRRLTLCIKSTVDTYKDEPILRNNVVSVVKHNSIEFGRSLLAKLKSN